MKRGVYCQKKKKSPAKKNSKTSRQPDMLTTHNSGAQRLLTVSDLTASIRGLLETTFAFVTVVGEISNLRKPFSGHSYFTLKDESAQIRAVLFKTQQRYLAFVPEDGRQAICRGRITVYEARGEYQLVVDSMEEYGAGSLQLAFERLKQKLAAEGLFDPAAKKKIPKFSRTIALITSPTGAAVHDFLVTTRKRLPGQHVEIMPVRVQGDEAAAEIAQAILDANLRAEADVIVLCRGGGSMEDLWAFNEEKVARAIHHSVIPVVTGIGHEIDYTIADLAADLRTVTPTAAAEAVTPDRAELAPRVAVLKQRLARSLSSAAVQRHSKVAELRRFLLTCRTGPQHLGLRLDSKTAAIIHAVIASLHHKKNHADKLTARLMKHDPGSTTRHERIRLAGLRRQLLSLTQRNIERKTFAAQTIASRLQSANPQSVLDRGYAIVMDTRTGLVIRNAAAAMLDQSLDVRLAKGELTVRVEKKSSTPK